MTIVMVHRLKKNSMTLSSSQKLSEMLQKNLYVTELRYKWVSYYAVH